MSETNQTVERKRIVKANLCLRFYRASGWTREDVRKLLCADQRLSRVVPRYFDERDKIRLGCNNFELDDGLPHEDCDYFAVYGVIDPFCPEALAKHDIV